MSAAEGHFEPAVGRIDPSPLEGRADSTEVRRATRRPVPFSDSVYSDASRAVATSVASDSMTRALAARGASRSPADIRSELRGPNAPRRLRSYL